MILKAEKEIGLNGAKVEVKFQLHTSVVSGPVPPIGDITIEDLRSVLSDIEREFLKKITKKEK